MTYRDPIYLGTVDDIGDNTIVMSTYGYSICRHCGGSGKTDNGDCGHCQGAGLTSQLVIDDSCHRKPARAHPTLLQARTTDFRIPRNVA